MTGGLSGPTPATGRRRRRPNKAKTGTSWATNHSSSGRAAATTIQASASVRFNRPGLDMDPGGIGKGYAVDRVAAVLREAGITSGFISAATSTVYGIGVPPSDPRGWEVRIVHPKDRNQTVALVHLKDESLSTSGNYEKFFVAGGRMYRVCCRSPWSHRGRLTAKPGPNRFT